MNDKNSKNFFGKFSSEIIREIKTIDIKSHKSTHASAFLVWYSKPTTDVKHVIELGSGTGIVALSLAKLYNLHVDGIELQEELVTLANIGIEINNLKEMVTFYNLDVADVRKQFKPESYDMVISNFPFHIGKGSPDKIRRLSRNATLDLVNSFVEATAYLLRNKGTFVYVTSPKIFIYLLKKLADKNLIAQKMAVYHGGYNKFAKLVAVRGKKNGGYDLTIESVFDYSKIQSSD